MLSAPRICDRGAQRPLGLPQRHLSPLPPTPSGRPSHPAVPSATSADASGGGTVRREVLTPSQRSKLNTADDRSWYALPRLCYHCDDGFRRKLTQLYRERIPENGAVLDLMSSWVSHLPPEASYSQVIGHGLNAEELSKNDRLDRWFVRNLNEEPDGWALQDAAFDAVLICCSAQYQQRPEAVFAEIHRVLKPGGVCIVSFTNRLFYEKAVAAWRDASMYGRVQLIKQYFMAVEGFGAPEAVTGPAGEAPAAPWVSGVVEAAQRLLAGGGLEGGDPFHAVIAYKQGDAANKSV